MRNIKDLMNLKGRTALITGATGGIGQAAAITIADLDRGGITEEVLSEQE